MKRRTLIALVGTISLVACGGGTERFETPDVSGPPTVRPDVVDAHARQFDEDVPDRNAGSEEEQAAAAYILGVLQQNGYFARLEAVPVEDLVRSTNVIAQPSGADVADALVVVSYGTTPGGGSASEEIGLFLELSRALNVTEPHHAVHFAAVGARRDLLGERRLIKLLLDESRDPFVVHLVETEAELLVAGDRADEIESGSSASSAAGAADPFEQAGFDTLVMGGEPSAVGGALVPFLAGFRQ